MKKYFNKILCFLSVSIIVFSSFCFSSSAAQNSDNTFQMSISKPDTAGNTGYIEILMQSSSGSYAVRTFSWSFYLTTQNYTSDNSPDFDAINIPMCVKVESKKITFSFQYVSPYWDAEAFIYTISNGGSSQFYSFDRYDTKYEWSLSSGSAYSIVSVHAYGNAVVTESLSNPEFYVLYSGDVVEYRQLLDVISILNRLASNDETIISKLQTIINNTDTVEDKLKSAVSLLTTIETDLDDVNSELDRIESNTDDLESKLDKIISILDNKNQDTPKPDTSTTDDYNSKEQELIGGTSAGRDEANTVFTDFNSTLSDNVGRGLLAVSAIMKEFIGFSGLSWLSSLLYFSLGLGIFGFILGMGFFLLSASASKEARSNARESHKLRSEFYKSATNFYNSRRRK